MKTTRCPWCESKPLYIRYHDEIWGVPEHDDRALFEKLTLDGFQAGLSWWIILKKTENFRSAFDGFEPKIIARYDEAKLIALQSNAGIVRNKAKIRAAVTNAQAYLRLAEEGVGFADFLWDFVDGQTVQNQWTEQGQLPAQTTTSQAMAKALKKRGFKFCGPTITYAFMQAVGMVNDHLVSCHCYNKCATRR
jgi:DNA-3-methyladenine glycosylase I